MHGVSGLCACGVLKWLLAQATALLPTRGALLTLADTEVTPKVQRDVLPPESPYAGPVRLSARLHVELSRTAARGSRYEADPTPSAPGAAEGTLSSEGAQSAASRQVSGGEASTADAGSGAEHKRNAQPTALLPGPDARLSIPLASCVGTSVATRTEAEEACMREAASASPVAREHPPETGTLSKEPLAACVGAEALRRALAALRRSGADGSSHAALASSLRSAPTSTGTATIAAANAQTGQPAPDTSPAAPVSEVVPSQDAGAAVPLPGPAAMAAAAATLRSLLRHGLVRRVPGFSNVAYVASEHSQRFLLLPQFDAAHPPPPTLPGGLEVHAQVPGFGAVEAQPVIVTAIVTAASVLTSSEEVQPAAASQGPPLAHGGAPVGGEAAADAVRQLPSADVEGTPPGPDMAAVADSGAVASRSQPEQASPQPSPSAEGLEAVGDVAAQQLPQSTVLPQEQMIRPWLDHAGAMNAPLWRDLSGKAVTLVLRHPGALHLTHALATRAAILLHIAKQLMQCEGTCEQHLARYEVGTRSRLVPAC